VAGPAPVAAPPDLVHVTGPAGGTEGTGWRIEHDVYERETRVVVESASEARLEGATVRRRDEVMAGVSPHDPARAFAESQTDVEVAWPEVTARAIARVELRSNSERFGFDLRLDVFEDGVPLRTRTWRSERPRGLS
jgi:hypothetical protein